jgi:hypothetical protein
MQEARALAELFAQDGDAVAPPLGRVVPQGIIAPHLFAEPHTDMRPRAEPRQVAPVRIDELVAVDVLGQIGDRADPQLHAPLSSRIAPDAKPKTRAAIIDAGPNTNLDEVGVGTVRPSRRAPSGRSSG